jgi:hypothetical protein
MNGQELRSSSESANGALVVTGIAKLRRAMADGSRFATVYLELEVEPATGTVTKVVVDGVPKLGGSLVERILLGWNISDEVEHAIAEIRERYLCPSCEAVCAALANAHRIWDQVRH